MRKLKVISMFVLLALLLSAGIGATMSQDTPAQGNAHAAATPQPPSADLQPGVREFIADTYLAHATEYPDPNEPVELLRLYLEGRQLLREGRVEEAVELFTPAIAEYPECRHAHAGLGAALWQRYQSTQAKNDLHSAVGEFVQAAEIGMGYGKVRYTHRIAEGLVQLGEAKKVDEFFPRALQVGDRSYLTHLHYGRALAWLNDDRAEEWYQKAIEIQPEGNFDAQAYYTEWLLDHGREDDVLGLIDAQQTAYYLRFLRGVALERLGRVDEAALDYAYSADFTRDFPVPARYRIEGGEAQKGIVFERERKSKGEGLQAPLLVSESQVRRGLAYLIYGEAPEENRGGQRAVGWTVRTRVFRGGSPVDYCVGSSQGSTLADKYKYWICREFDGTCDAWCADPSTTSCPSSWSANDAGYNVFWGFAPEPIGNWCPSGEGEPWGSPCWYNVLCLYPNKDGANAEGPIAFHGLSQCPGSGGPFGCSTCKNFVCGNGYPDNCFYSHP